jgi:subtilisin
MEFPLRFLHLAFAASVVEHRWQVPHQGETMGKKLCRFLPLALLVVATSFQFSYADVGSSHSIVEAETAHLHSIPESLTPSFEWALNRIEAPAVWSRGIKGEGVVVAVVDSGLALHHHQLRGQVYVNPREVWNGRDDDGNGYVDDVSGWDFARRSPYADDFTGHGTIISGIIAADPQKGRIHGLAPLAKILPLSFMDPRGSGNLFDAVEAMHYAANQGAKILLVPWGIEQHHPALLNAVRNLEARGVLIVAAAGNGGVDLGRRTWYPTSYGGPSVISVGSSDHREMLAMFSSYGYPVHLVAPGVDVAGTTNRDGYAFMNSTTASAALVAGTAALLWSHKPQAQAHQIRQALIESVDQGRFPVMSSGRLNVRRAIESIERIVGND